MKNNATLLIVMFSGLLLAAGTCPAQVYTITDLGPGVAWGINDAGQVVGGRPSDGSALGGAFLWSNGSMQDLGECPFNIAYGINSVGQVVGFTGCFEGQRAFLWSSGVTQYLDTLPGGSEGFGFAINAAGQVVGSSRTADGNEHAVLWSNGSIQDLGTLLGETSSVARGINDAGQVVGASGSHAFLWSNGFMQDLGTLRGGSWSQACGINAVGQVVGWSGMAREDQHAFLWSKGSMQDLGALPGTTHSIGYSVNSLGQVVGVSYFFAGEDYSHAFLWRGGFMQDLNSRINFPEGSKWTQMTATSINTFGQIVGEGSVNGEQHAFLLTPYSYFSAEVQPPVKSDGSSVFSSSRGVVPIRFSLYRNGDPTCELPPATVAVKRVSDGANLADGNFRTAGCQYIDILAASPLGVGTYQVDISIEGIAVGHAVFALQ